MIATPKSHRIVDDRQECRAEYTKSGSETSLGVSVTREPAQHNHGYIEEYGE
jgi:hypothetical protein